jgi:hypothetical protein
VKLPKRIFTTKRNPRRSINDNATRVCTQKSSSEVQAINDRIDNTWAHEMSSNGWNTVTMPGTLDTSCTSGSLTQVNGCGNADISISPTVQAVKRRSTRSVRNRVQSFKSDEAMHMLVKDDTEHNCTASSSDDFQQLDELVDWASKGICGVSSGTVTKEKDFEHNKAIEIDRTAKSELPREDSNLLGSYTNLAFPASDQILLSNLCPRLPKVSEKTSEVSNTSSNQESYIDEEFDSKVRSYMAELNSNESSKVTWCPRTSPQSQSSYSCNFFKLYTTLDQ